jgi:TonB family protein
MPAPTGNVHVDLTGVLADSYAGATTAPAGIPDTLLVTVSYDSTGVLSHVTAHARAGVAVEADGAGELFRPRFLPTGHPRSHAHLLFIRNGEPDLRAYRVRSECEPVLLNKRHIVRQMDFLANDLRDETRVVVWLYIDAEGKVLNSIVNRSSGDIGTDQEMSRIARTGRFAPALQDEFAVPVWIALPLNVKAQPRFLRPGDCPPPEVQSIPCVQ